jgi:glycosyltransferase involved in cell wall biosynthesis
MSGHVLLQKTLTLALPFPKTSVEAEQDEFARQLDQFAGSEFISSILLLHEGAATMPRVTASTAQRINLIRMDSWFSGIGVERMLEASATDLLLLMVSGGSLEIERRALEQLLSVADESGAGLVYADYRQIRGAEIAEQMTLNYQTGSLRENFDFGAMLYISKQAADEARRKYGPVESTLRWAGLYDLRLKVSADFPLHRIPEPLYHIRASAEGRPAPAQAAAMQILGRLDAAHPGHQSEAEQVASAHLRRLGAYLEESFSIVPAPEHEFPVEASIIIPVRNRERTIEQAARSALSQSASFFFNVIVIDDNSTDRTTEILRQLARQDKRLVHKMASRPDLGIGGLWNEAIYSPECGLYALQLDSDDVYADAHALEKMVSKFWEPPATGAPAAQVANSPRYAMTIGSFARVDFNLQRLPVAPVEHRELSPENGRNNALRVDGPGAPRAFYVPLLRRLGFPNVSFGEDYAIFLRISRQYEVGRVFDTIYLAREWEGNSVQSLPLGNIKSINVKDLIPTGALKERDFLFMLRPVLLPLVAASKNRYQEYKDWLRTVEIQARIKMNRAKFMKE